MNLALVAGGLFGMSIYLLIDHVDEVLDALVPHEDPIDSVEDA